ncbi:hypothetical protein HOO65_010352 [Ceratocystis lukuohia]|uniref:Uncharacterized protein n=1 Tax=Ceratocystis lukuohia TaxID=2019550 RepID=A0ABR4MRW2_9PEZI
MPGNNKVRFFFYLIFFYFCFRVTASVPPGGQEKEFTIQPVPGADQQNQGQIDPKFAPFKANPGPVRQDLGGVPFEGTKEDRQARAAELNKKGGGQLGRLIRWCLTPIAKYTTL